MVFLRELLERIIDPLWGSYCEIFSTFMHTIMHKSLHDKTMNFRFQYKGVTV